MVEVITVDAVGPCDFKWSRVYIHAVYRHYRGLAQLVAHSADIRKVLGSSPKSTTNEAPF